VNTYVKIGLVVVIMSIFANMMFRGGADKDIDIPGLIRNGALVIDTRSASEFSSGHIENAIHIPYDLVANVIEKHEPDKERAIIVYCHSGVRSAAAKQALQQAGYQNVVNGGGLHHMEKALKQ
jgi:rhodanese-related sulfurtransferase